MPKQPDRKGGGAGAGRQGPVEASDQTPLPSARDDAQLFLGQLHGVLHTAVENAGRWCSQEQIEAITGAYDDVGRHFGATQAALNGGNHDERLEAAGLSGMQAEPKKRGFFNGLRRFYRAAKSSAAELAGPLRSVLRWSHTYVSSLASFIPGAEAIKEFIEVVVNSIDDWQETADGKAGSETRRPNEP